MGQIVTERILKDRGALRKKLDESRYSSDEMDVILLDFQEKYELFEEVERKLAEELRGYESVHSVMSRIKSPASLFEKILRKDNPQRQKITLANYTSQITDLVGIRVLYLYASDWYSVYCQIEENHKPDRHEKPIVKLRLGDDTTIYTGLADPSCIEIDDSGIYRSVHYIIRDNQNSNIFAEVQTRTIFEEGWSEINHRIYKNSQEDSSVIAISAVLSRTVGVCNELGMLLGSKYNRDASQVISSKAEASVAQGELFEDILLRFLREST